MAAPSNSSSDYGTRVKHVLRATPLIDGHNDWPEALRNQEGGGRWSVDLRDLDRKPLPYNTDIARLRRGMVGGQFWSVFVSPDLPGQQQVEETLEQIDLVKSFVARYTIALPQTVHLDKTTLTLPAFHRDQVVLPPPGAEVVGGSVFCPTTS